MSVSQVDTSQYTHIHFAFALIDRHDYSLNITSIQGQLPFFSALTGVKKILSVGGWDFSTSPDTYMIFREAVKPANRGKLIKSVVDVLNKYDLDGIDWDWEYPDEPDIPGIPAGTRADSTNYFAMLSELQDRLKGTGKTIAVTAPASYWYLRRFPIQAISKVVDYIVYMTYDLHGQWDYGNPYVDPGCPGGNCLRSHVNITETINALSMITKAGVSNTQIAVGVSSYGRSFKMTKIGCWTTMCTYTGPKSGALPGECTETAGYIADAEIDSVIADNPSAQSHWDGKSFSNILVYNQTQWVSYMNESNKAIRRALYDQVFTFLGTADWAVDLQGEGGSSGSSNGGGSSSMGYIGPTVWSESSPKVTGKPGQTLVWPPLQLSSKTTISFPLWTTILSLSTLSTSTVTSWGTTSTQLINKILTIPTVLTIPPVTTTAIPVWNVILPTKTTDTVINLTSSVQPPQFTVTVTPVWSGTTSVVKPTTTTQNSTIVAWLGTTYTLPPETETVGSSTKIIGGTTGTPIPIKITPRPHPTTVDKTKDPKLNTKTTEWKPGSPVSPTCKAGEKCGDPCGWWCDPGCPFCPPNLFGNQGGTGPDGEPSSSESTTSTKTTTTTTTSSQSPSYTAAGFHVDLGDGFPTSLPPWSDFESVTSSLSSVWSSRHHRHTTTTTKKPTTTQSPTTATSTGPPQPTSRAKYVSYFVMSMYSGSQWVFEWQVMDSIGGVTWYPCDTSPDYETSADTVPPNPSFPDEDLGPFTSHGHDGCWYRAGDDDSVGTMTCPGVDDIYCEKSPDYNKEFDCSTGPVLVSVLQCYW